MEGLEFRAADREDLPDMAHLFTKRSEEERLERMQRRYEREPDGWHVALQHGRVVGCCQAVMLSGRDAWLQWMRIDPEVQNSGIGGRFIDYIEAQALAGGARVLRLSTMTDNGRVHHLMGGLRGYTEWARWTRLQGLRRDRVQRLAAPWPVERADDPEEILEWLRVQPGYHASFAAVTCPSDFRKFVSLDRDVLADLIDRGGRSGCMVARIDDEIEAVALYAAQGGELRVLQAVARTLEGGAAAVHAALAEGRPREKLTVQVAGCEAALAAKLYEQLKGPRSKRHDYYVFGKRVE